MNRLFITVSAGAAGAISAAMVLAGAAFAQPNDNDQLSENAAEAVAQLQAQGYQVQVFGNDDMPLGFCKVSQVARAGEQQPSGATVYVDCSYDQAEQ